VIDLHHPPPSWIATELTPFAAALHIPADLSSGRRSLLVEQNARMALKVADYGYVLESCRLTLGGKHDDLLRDPNIVSAYLGAGKRAPVTHDRNTVS
jgi:branched-chain amino acid transport system ATP-binding protein